MAAGTWQVYGLAARNIHNKLIDLDGNANLYMMFTAATHTPNVDTHEDEADLTNIVSGTNVPAAGIAITGATLTYNATNNTLTFDCADVSVANATLVTGARNAHIVDKTAGAAASNYLVAYVTFDGDLTPNNGTLSVTIDPTGVFTLTV